MSSDLYGRILDLGAELWVFGDYSERYAIVFKTTKECWNNVDAAMDLICDISSENKDIHLECLPESIAKRRTNARPTEDDEYLFI